MVFISYRRSDSTERAELLEKVLLSKGYDKSAIFIDRHTIGAEAFPARCEKAILACSAFVLIVSKDSFVERDGEDYYYQEIDCAINNQKKIIPVIFDGAFDEKTIPERFTSKGLHLTNAITYNAEYSDEFEKKLLRFLSAGEKPSFVRRLAELFAMPLLVVTIYLGISAIAGVFRYLVDSYWLPEKKRVEVASAHLQRDNEGTYFYVTRDSIYIFSEGKGVQRVVNRYSAAHSALSIDVDVNDLYRIGFWSTAVGLVYGYSKIHYKPHGGKQAVAYIAAVIAIAAGVGLGFVVERMVFPVQESRLIRKDLRDPSFWRTIISRRSDQVWIQQQF